MTGGPSQQEQGSQTSAWTNLNSLFGTANTAAQGYGSSGNAAGASAQNFFQSLLGGNRTATANAVAPAAEASTAAAQAQKNALASQGTGRTGGAVDKSQQLDDATRASTDSLIGGAAPAAASALQGISAQDTSAMLSALGLSGSSSSTLGSQTTGEITAQQQASAQMWSSLISGAAKVGAIAATGGAAAPLVAAESFSN